jgi:fibronectin type 3 domain-containing protein
VVGRDPVIESAPSDEVCVTVRDIFPPAAPTGVAALVREGAAEVSWSPSPESDLAGYRVYRASGEQPPRRVADRPPDQTSFRETGLPAGVHLYTITAVDRDGNESAPSRPAEVRIP